MKKIIPLLLAVLLLCGCAETTPEQTLPATTTGETTETTVETTVPPTTQEVTIPPTTEATVPPTTAAPTTPATVPEPTVPPVTDPEPNYQWDGTPVIYSGAQVHYLGKKGNGHDVSWARKYIPEYVMIHFCSAVVNHRKDPYNMEYVRQTFIDADVSIHYILDRDGTVYCYVSEDRAAWHAGKGTWLDDPKYTNKMNYYSIGIEVVGMGSYKDMSGYLTKKEYEALDPELLGFTDAQYTSLKALVEDICGRYDIPLDRDHVIGHQEYSPKKKDPGELFDWSRIVP